MQREMSPVVVWVLIAVVAIVVIGLGWRFVGPSRFRADTSGSEKAMEQVKQGQPLYQPPANAPVPGAGGRRPANQPMMPPMMGGSGGGTTAPPGN